MSGRQGYLAALYIGILNKALPTLWEPGFLFMQDNTSIHTSYLTRQWFEENGVEVLEWLPYSLDFNLIEYLWYWLKKHVYDVRPDIEEVYGDVDYIQDVLYNVLEKVWTLIDPKIIKDLVKNMEKRVRAVVNADGWYTKY